MSHCTQWTWAGLYQRAGLEILYATNIPLEFKPALLPTCDTKSHMQLDKLHVKTLGDLYLNDTFISIDKRKSHREYTMLDIFLYFRL